MVPTIALDCTPLIGQTGGVGTFVRGALGALAARGEHRLSAYALSWRGRGALAGVVPRDVRIVQRRLPAGALLRAWERSSWPWAELWTGAVDIVHGTNFVVPPARGAATVVTVHDLTAVRYPDLCAPVTLRYPVLVRRAVQRGAFVHVPSAYVAGEVTAALEVPSERVRVVAHGLDHVRPHPGDCGGAGPPYALALGTVEPRKDYPGLVRAFDAMASARPDLRLVIAGEDGWAAGQLADAIDMSPHRSRIERRRGVDDHERARLLGGAAVFVYASVYEGFGLPPLEAMAAGTPVVATAAGAVPDTVADAAMVVPVGDVDALASAMARVLDDGELRTTLRTRGVARAREFTWAACADGLTALYADAVEAAR